MDELEVCAERTSLFGLCTTLSKLCHGPAGDGLRDYIRSRQSISGNPLITPASEVPESTSTEDQNVSPTEEASLEEKEIDEASIIASKRDEEESLSDLLDSLSQYVLKEKTPDPGIDEKLSPCLLLALLDVANADLNNKQRNSDIQLTQLLPMLFTLAKKCTGESHLCLIRSLMDWLKMCGQYLSQKEVVEKLKKNTTGKHQAMLDATCYILDYLSDILNSLKCVSGSSPDVSSRPTDELDSSFETFAGLAGPGPIPLMDADSDWTEDVDVPSECGEEDESDDGDESDDENKKLYCTYVSQKDYKTQHWYYCVTCGLVDTMGVCSACVRICHRGHEVVYSKLSSFYCDCPSRQDACIASNRFTVGLDDANDRRSQEEKDSSMSSFQHSASSAPRHSSKHRSSLSLSKKSQHSKIQDTAIDNQKLYSHIGKLIEKDLEALMKLFSSALFQETVRHINELLKFILPTITNSAFQSSPIGYSLKTKSALEELHSLPKTIEFSDKLMVPTLGSQEGAFENVKINFSGEQGNTIRQLMSSNVLRRVGMCVLSSLTGKRQHLAVSHERGKITLLQLSTLLKQAHSSKKKLTLTRLSSAPVPFTVISIWSNQCNDEVLAVCGLKDVHILTFNHTGIVSGQIALHPHLEAGNYVIKAVWLPGSQSQIAIVTADFVKIYDLSVDTSTPQYYFVLPSGKIRDVTLVFAETLMDEKNNRFLLLISSTGHIYLQSMNDESSAKNGPFYMTTQLDVRHPQVTETNGYINGGGVSIYYSHAFQMLFVSYNMGKSFMAPLTHITNELTHLFILELKPGHHGNSSSTIGSVVNVQSGAPSLFDSSSTSTSPSSSNGHQALCHWVEIAGHPGLILAMSQTSNNVWIFQIKPEKIFAQEIRFLSSKAKIADMVAVRHSTGHDSDSRTTLILLCEDGSLRIYMASTDAAYNWVPSPVNYENVINKVSSHSQGGKWSKRKGAKSHSTLQRSTGTVLSSSDIYKMFPVDTFEHCQQMSDIEFGGPDMLEVYNVDQLKMRLYTPGLYVASTKNKFSIEVTNNDPTMVICGLSVLVGSQDPNQAPSSLEMFGRTLQITINRSRWFDFPFAREESLNSDRTVVINFTVSSDVNCVTIIDSLKIYGKTKDAFGWPEESDEAGQSLGTVSTSNSYSRNERIVSPVSKAMINLSISSKTFSTVSALDHLLLVSLNVLTSSFKHLEPHSCTIIRDSLLEYGRELLVVPYSTTISSIIKSAMLSVHSSKSSFNEYRDQALIKYVLSGLESGQGGDGEAFFRFLTILKTISSARPNNFVKFVESNLIMDTDFNNLYQSQDLSSLASSRLRFGVVPLCDSKSDKSQKWMSSLCQPSVISYIYSTHSVNSPLVSLIINLNQTFWALCSKQPANAILSPIATRGVVNTEATVSSLVEIIHTVTLLDIKHVRLAALLYLQLLLCPLSSISFATKKTLSRLLKTKLRKKKPEKQNNLTEPGCSKTYDVLREGSYVSQLMAESIRYGPSLHVDLTSENDSIGSTSMTAQGAQSIDPNLLSNQAGSIDDQSRLSDTTTSAVPSDDDEASAAATSASTLHVSPACQEDKKVDPIGSKSGPFDDLNSISEQFDFLIASAQSTVPEIDSKLDAIKLNEVKLELLKNLIDYLPQLRDPSISGLRVIPLMQVIVLLSTSGEELEGKSNEAQHELILTLLSKMLQELSFGLKEVSSLTERSNANEVKLIILRLFSIFMSRKSSSSSKILPDFQTASATAFCLSKSNMMEFCLQILVNLLDFWKEMESEEKDREEGVSNRQARLGEQLLRVGKKNTSPDNLSPFFLRQYVKSHSKDVFENYPELLTEMLLRLPYQIAKMIINSSGGSSKVSQTGKYALPPSSLFAPTWIQILCRYLMIPNLTSYVRKQVRKLLSFICGSKERYREVRDFHALESHLQNIRAICRSGGFIEGTFSNGPISLSYDSMITLIDHLKACNDISSNRSQNWQKYLLQKDTTALTFFLQISYLINEGVTPIIMLLLQSALCPKIVSSNIVSINVEFSRASSKESPLFDASQGSLSDNYNSQLSQQLMSSTDSRILVQFILSFLLDSNSTSLRWQAHTFIYFLWKNFLPEQQETLLNIFWQLWPCLPQYGRRASHFVDLLGCFTIRCNFIDQHKDHDIIEQILHVLRRQNEIIALHPNGNLYNSLQALVEFDGYYLESAPCLVCNNPEVNYSNIKLSSIKVDSRFTTTNQIVKLLGTHIISRIVIRITDIKRSKMVKTFNIYYNNKSVHSVVELKNKMALWNKARRVVLSPGQSEVKIAFSLPIIACNLMMEYADFYENIQASSETLQCPRCSASVAANPGVCDNCGENVFQCHKCRAINYDEKDPFLCNSCGFCKYAKFEVNLLAKPTCAVDPIENEEDHKKTVLNINSLLDKADRVYRSLISNKPVLENLIARIQDYPTSMDQQFVTSFGDSSAALYNATVLLDNRTGSNLISSLGQSAPQSNAPVTTGSHVNRSIQQLAIRYCQECNRLFDELSRIIQKVTASRRELIEYDNSQRELDTNIRQGSVRVAGQRRESRMFSSGHSPVSSRCYGCAAATVDHCIGLLKALATIPKYRQLMCIKGVIPEIAQNNLRTGSLQARNEVRQLLCNLTRDNARATSDLNNLLMDKITVAVKGRLGHSWDLAASIKDEMALLACSLDKEDSCWELRLRCVIQLFIMSLSMNSPAVMESLTLPCLRLLRKLIRPQPPTTRRNKDKTTDELATVQSVGFQVNFHLGQWLNGDTRHSFRAWRQRSINKTDSPPSMSFESFRPSTWACKNRAEAHTMYLCEKYFSRWQEKVKLSKCGEILWRPITLQLLKNNWLKRIIFNPVSQTARFYGCSLIEELYRIETRRSTIVDLLTSYLCELSSAGECGAEFFRLYHNIVRADHWKYYLALRGHIHQLGALITREIDQLQQLEEYTFNSYLSQGFALKMLVDLLTVYVDVDEIRRKYKRNLMGFVLDGYLSLRKLLVQRTKLIDDAQETLLELLEEMTISNEDETSEFMRICVDAVRKCPLDDLQTPQFIFERLCLIIYPEENDNSEFYIILEKDAQQEDFLQGRMVGNPYSSNEPGMGPLMRDIKNKICQDCELVALLDDDSGMELLVNNKIISLDLSVDLVYRKIWCQDVLGESAASADAMRIVYRMRGLMGDATEEFVETLDTNNPTEADEEQIYRMAIVMATCGGIEVMLQRMSLIDNLSPRSRSSLAVLLKLFNHCVKVSANRKKLIQPQLKSISIIINILKLLLISGVDNQSNCNLLEQVLILMEKILIEASQMNQAEYDEFCVTCGNADDVTFLLKCASAPSMKNQHAILNSLLRIIPFLTLGNESKTLALISNFRPHLDFIKFDFEHNGDDIALVELFCSLVSLIEHNENGNRLKDLIAQEGIVKNALDYLTLGQHKFSILTSNEEWKEFTSRPALKYVLRILTGLSSGHLNTSLMVSDECIPTIHALEQVSSDTHVGSLAENLLEAIKQHPAVAIKIEEVRRQTKEEKKRLAMQVRQKQLGALGMKTNERGQVTAKTAILNQFGDLAEEQGLVCVICREGYKFQPSKVLGIYTFTKRCAVEEYETKTRKTQGYSTVTHFNIVHVDCHMAAVRHARARDEWESASLQNANTRCNGLLPLWGPQVQESSFASCLARHNTYIQDCTGHRDVNYSSCVHDLKHLLLRFAHERSFSEDSGGGGQESNVHLIPYMVHMALYVLNSSRAYGREIKKLTAFLESPQNKWAEQSFEIDGPHYWTLMFSLLNPPSAWKSKKVDLLKRLLVAQHVRQVLPATTGALAQSPAEYAIYKPVLIYFSLIDSLYAILFKNVPNEEEWSLSVAEYIRHNDQPLLEATNKMLSFYQEDILPCASFVEFCDAAALLEEIADPQQFLESAILASSSNAAASTSS